MPSASREAEERGISRGDNRHGRHQVQGSRRSGEVSHSSERRETEEEQRGDEHGGEEGRGINQLTYSIKTASVLKKEEERHTLGGWEVGEENQERGRKGLSR